MDWVQGAVIVVAIIASITGIVCTIEMVIKMPRPTKDYEFRSEIICLKGHIEGLKKEVAMWKDRGDRHSAGRDCAEKNLQAMYEIFQKMISEATEIKNLKELLGKALDKKG